MFLNDHATKVLTEKNLTYRVRILAEEAKTGTPYVADIFSNTDRSKVVLTGEKSPTAESAVENALLAADKIPLGRSISETVSEANKALGEKDAQLLAARKEVEELRAKLAAAAPAKPKN